MDDVARGTQRRPGGARAGTAAAREGGVRARPRAGDGDRQPHARQLLRPGRTFAEERPSSACTRRWPRARTWSTSAACKAGVGHEVTVTEEIRRVVPFVARVRVALPGSGDQRGHLAARVGRAACEAGADLINDTWAGCDPRWPRSRPGSAPGIVCSHTGGAAPRTNPFRVVLPRRGGGRDRPRARARRADGRGRRRPGADRHRPDARFRQEHLALAWRSPGGSAS